MRRDSAGRNDPDLKDGFYYAWDALLKKMSNDELRKHPAVGVTRKLAKAYAHHVGGELPSEAQWEFAARSRGKNQLYVWGDGPGPRNANVHQAIVVGIETLPVGLSTDDRTAQGVLDLAGNVREWCRDVWKIYPQVEPGRDPVQVPTSDDANPLFVIRGGSYNTPSETARVTWRSDLGGTESLEYKARNDYYEKDLGFRVVLEIVDVPEKLIGPPGPSTVPSGSSAHDFRPSDDEIGTTAGFVSAVRRVRAMLAGGCPGTRRSRPGREGARCWSGIERYEDQLAFPRCRGAARDAADLGRWLITSAGWAPSSVLLLTDQDPSALGFEGPAARPDHRRPTKANLEWGAREWLAQGPGPGTCCSCISPGRR